MGVAHKITDGVVEFVLLEKAANPSISCRALTARVAEEFQIHLSKSSVNAILKKAQLSSPVGRRAEEPAPKKERVFRIPEAKKRQMIEGLVKVAGGALPDGSDGLSPGGTSAGSAISASSASPARPAPDPVIDGAGMIFLRAAECDLARGPLLSECLQGEAGREEAHIRALSLLQGFNITSREDLLAYHGTGLWLMAGGGGDPRALDGWMSQYSDWRKAFLSFLVKARAMMTKVASFELVREDGTSFFIDAQKAALWSKNVQSDFSASLAQAAGVLASEILKNVQSVVLCSLSPKNKEAQTVEHPAFEGFVETFEARHGKRLVKVSFFDEKGKKIANFDADPGARRSFIVGLWPWQREFKDVLDKAKPVAKGKIQKNDPAPLGEIVFKEVRAPGVFDIARPQAERLRCVFLYEAFAVVPFLGLISNDDRPAQAIVETYLERWPYLTKGAVYQRLEAGAAPDQGRGQRLRPDLMGFLKTSTDPAFALIQAAGHLLNDHAKTRFFPETYRAADFYTMHHRFFSLPGRITETRDRYEAWLYLSGENRAYYQDLIFAVQAVNEARVMTSHGKIIYINIK